MKKLKRGICLACLFSLLLSAMSAATANESAYLHDPVRNAQVMEDVIVDPNAVYGFRPDPASARLGSFADADWTDPVKVAEWRQQRITYHDGFTRMYEVWHEMEAAGETVEAIARAVSALRNEIRLASYDGNPEGLALVKQSNLQKYGNENGPTADSLFEKYGSWETVLLKSFSENPGMDACLGLYDTYYDNYARLGSITEVSEYRVTVQRGDWLSTIALKYYGDASAWRRIYEANKALIKNPDLIYAGQVLTVPV